MQQNKPVCYSFGCTGDLSFEMGLIALTQASIIFIDDENNLQTIANIKKLMQKKQIRYVDYYTILNLDSSHASLLHTYPTSSLATEPVSLMMNTLKHSKVDIFKIDIQKDIDYKTAITLINSDYKPSIICTKLHNVAIDSMQKLISLLFNNEYSVFHRHKNNLTFIHQSRKKSPSALSQELHTELSSLPTGVMKTHVFFDWFLIDGKNMLETEFRVYQKLNTCPVNKNINYIAAPWWSILQDSRKMRELPKKYFDGGFTVCQHIRFEEALPLFKRMGLSLIFTPHVNKYYFGILVKPFLHYPECGIDPQPHKDIWYSLIGAATHKTRAKIFKLQHSSEAIIKERKMFHGALNKKTKKRHAEEYKDVLARSRFSLCPRGTGTGIIRFGESLQAGAIPVVIADGAQFPDPIHTQECMIQIPENKISSIETILKDIPLDKELKMREHCLALYKSILKGNNYVQTIHDTIHSLPLY